MQKLNELNPADQVRNKWQIRPEAGVNIEEVMLPEYWANVSNRLTVGDEISVFAKDGTYFANILVLAVAEKSTGQTVRAQWAKVFLLNKVNIADSKAPTVFDETKYDIKWRGASKFSAIRKSDKTILRDGFVEREDAAIWLKTHDEEMAA